MNTTSTNSNSIRTGRTGDRLISALSIAGSDSGGGAGIQADLKTFRACGVHGVTAITAITAQNTRAVQDVMILPARRVRAQIDAVFEDFDIRAVKLGMLGNAAVIGEVARALEFWKPPWVVLDPVMVATSGARLIDVAAETVLRDKLIPAADVLTPNLPEAETLLGHALPNDEARQLAGPALRALGAAAVLLKGGHGTGKTVVDRFFDETGEWQTEHPRQPWPVHGTGCVLSSALAAKLALGLPPLRAAQAAIALLQRALATAATPGGGEIRVLTLR